MSILRKSILVMLLLTGSWHLPALAVNVVINGTFSNITSTSGGTNSNPNCYDSRQPVATTVSPSIPNENPFNNQIRYGDPVGSSTGQGCSSGDNFNGNSNFVNKSGLGYQGGNTEVSCPAAGTRQPVSLGTFKHFNNPIFSSDKLTGFNLNISIAGANNNISVSAPGFVFEETSNTPPCAYGPDNGPCNDRVSLPNFSDAFEFNDGASSCVLVVTGFAPCNNLTGANVGDFITVERETSEACIVAQLEQTTPVTLSSVSTARTGDEVKVDWSTSSELFNVGFQLWGLDAVDSRWEKLHGWLVRSGSGNSVEPQSYSKTVRVPKSIKTLSALGISSVDNDGSEHYYGPFEPGQSYGNLSTLKPIAWNHIRSQTDEQMQARGYIKDRIHGYRKASTVKATDTSATQSMVEFQIPRPGVYRITAQQLLAAGADWRAISKRDIAVLDHLGESVVRHIAAKGTGKGSARTLGEQGDIYFYANEIDPQSGLYTESGVYRLVLDRYKSLDSQFQSKSGITQGYSEYYREQSVHEHDNQYTLSSAVDDPWLDSVILSYIDQPASYAAGIEVEADAMWDQDSTLTLQLGRSSELGSVDHDGDGVQDAEHTVEAVVLSPGAPGGLLPLGTEQASGRGQWAVDFTIAANTPLTVIDSKAVVGGIFKPGPGYAFSEVQVDSVSLSYARPYVARAGDEHLGFVAPNDGALAYSVTVPDTGWPLVFAHSNGNLVRVAPESQQKQVSTVHGTHRVVRFAALAGASSGVEPIQYWVSGKGGMLEVQGLSAKSIVSPASLLTQAAGMDMLIIAHPAFMTDGLSNYAQFKRNQGHAAAVIDYLDVVDSFGGGQPGPQGLTQYLRELSESGTLEHVLLVGGSSYDHTDKLGTGAMTFIPGHYGESAYSQYTVTDAPYVTDAADTLFASIGRWPVRSVSDLDAIIASSMAWSNTDRGAGSALAIAEHTIDGEGVDFAGALDGVIQQLPDSWNSQKVYVDEIRAQTPGSGLATALSAAKDQIVDALEAGPDVVLYNGHGTTSQLSNKALLKSSDISQIDTAGAQLWLPMSCYTTYYESTHVNTLAHQLLFSSKAVGISGSVLLSSQGHNTMAGTAILNGVFDQNLSIGEAVRTHKTARNSPILNTNLTHLGDPTLKM